MNRREKQALLCTIAVCFLFISRLSLQRRYFGFGTETDYLGGFLPEAQRLLAGEPLLLEFHPPLYSMALALVQTVTQDWLRTGLLISLLASAIALVTNFLFFRRLLGIWAGWGAILGLMAAGQFVEYSAYATSDIFSLALYSTCFLLSLSAIQKRLASHWALCGLAVGCLLLTRTNGITCLFIATLPFWSDASFKQKCQEFLYFALGLAIPLISWLAYAQLSSSQLTPAGTYANFALTYFSPSDRISGDARVRVEEKFDSLISVLSYDPIHIAKTYLKDLFSLSLKIFGMLQPPLSFFIPIGIFSFFKNKPGNTNLCIFYIVLTLLQVLLINFKAYEARYFLFLFPILGVAVSEAFRYLIFLMPQRKLKRAIAGFCAVCLLFSLALSYSASSKAVALSVGELPAAVPEIQKLNLSGASILARKPHVAFYTDSAQRVFPRVKTLPELRCALEAQLGAEPSGAKSLFLYYGSQERSYRDQLKELIDAEASPVWLSPIRRSEGSNQWVLYEYSPADALAAPSEPCSP